jgi:DNA-binding NarL/FixJ family response regulator
MMTPSIFGKRSNTARAAISSADSELLAAVPAVLRGELYDHPSMTRILLEDLLPEAHMVSIENARGSLSEREYDVLKMAAVGHTSAEITEQLSLSTKRVEIYRARGITKLGLRTQSTLVKFALQGGLMKSENRDNPKSLLTLRVKV